ncbi:MAG: D-aminoacylase [Treponemataceae bacterium]
MFDTLIKNVRIIDGGGGKIRTGDLAILAGRISKIAYQDEGSTHHDWKGREVIQGDGFVLSPGFIDVHTHDDTNVIRSPDMLAKISQGITTVIVGNCGISAAPVTLKGPAPAPMSLLGPDDVFVYPRFSQYRAAVEAAKPSVNVAALVGHTALRGNHMDTLDRLAKSDEIEKMRDQLREALDEGALGLSTGLAYANAYEATTDEIVALAELLAEAGGIYTTHMRTEFAAIIDAMDEAFTVGNRAGVPVVISHLKCAGVENWGRSEEVLRHLEQAGKTRLRGCDCYPYTASSSLLDLKQVNPTLRIDITWSTPHPEAAGKTLSDIASSWGLSLTAAAEKLLPAGAIYHNMSEADVDRIISHPATCIGSDGLPNDPLPHPRLWGAFPRVLSYYCREKKVFTLPQAIHKMTGRSAARYGLDERGLVKEGYWADLVLFNPDTIKDAATFLHPVRTAEGIRAVWVNGQLSYSEGAVQGSGAGRFLCRGTIRAEGFPFGTR